MVKAVSPVRLQENLMKAATLTGERFHRSAAEQVEYWAEIGRRVATVLDPDVLLSVTAGLARVKVEPVYGEPVEPDDVFQSMEVQRRHGSLKQAVTTSTVRFQSSSTHPGLLEQIDRDGKITVGQFQNGEFIPVEKYT